MSSYLSLGIRQNALNAKDNHDSEIIVIGAVFLALSTMGLIARMVSHAMRHKDVKLDDFLLFWAYAICVGETAMLIWAAKYAGFGRHFKTLSDAEIVSYEKVFYAAGLLQPALLASSKLSILILLDRIFITRMFRITARVLMGIVAAWYIAITLGAALICLPIKSLWNPAVPGHCGNQYLFDRIVPVPWIVTDFAILVAPLPVVRNLNMSMRSKIIVVALILVGCLTCVVSCVRYSKTFWAIEDPTWDTVGLADWQLIEANVTILCVCLIASKPVANYLVPDGLVRMGSYISRSLRSHRSKAEANEDPPLKDRLSGLSHHRHEGDIELHQHPSSTCSEDMAHSYV